MFHGDFAQLDVPVAGELVPTHLNGPADEVWFVRRQTSCPPALAPFPQQGHTAEHRRLARAGRRCAEGVLRLGRVPEVGEDVDTPRLNRRGLRILVLVDHVLIECLAHEVPNFGLQPGLAKRRKVLTRIAVEDQLVGNEPICVPRELLALGHLELRQARRELCRGENLVEDLVTDGVAFVQHGISLGSVPSLSARTEAHHRRAESGVDAYQRAA